MKETKGGGEAKILSPYKCVSAALTVFIKRRDEENTFIYTSISLFKIEF